jgi:hypothetical protein
MKIYATGHAALKFPSTRSYVVPGVKPEADPADWYEDEKREIPRTFEVVFAYGAAEVPDPLGKFMVANGLANRTKLFIPRAPSVT